MEKVEKEEEKSVDCGPDCPCERCRLMGFTPKMVLDSKEIYLFGAPVMVRLPVSNHYSMAGHVSINYETFHKYSIKDIVKLKCAHVDSLPGLKKLFICLKPG